MKSTFIRPGVSRTKSFLNRGGSGRIERTICKAARPSTSKYLATSSTFYWGTLLEKFEFSRALAVTDRLRLGAVMRDLGEEATIPRCRRRKPPGMPVVPAIRRCLGTYVPQGRLACENGRRDNVTKMTTSPLTRDENARILRNQRTPWQLRRRCSCGRANGIPSRLRH